MFFLLTNFLIMITLSIIINLLGIQPYLSANGISYESLMLFCLVWGMGGSIISLILSKRMAIWGMGVKVIDPAINHNEYRELVRIVHSLAQRANLRTMPEVGIYDSPEVNAFATGPSRNNSLVAVSTGLLRSMNRIQVEGVLGHEVAHIANGDMVTMTLVQGVVNAFVMFFARIVARIVGQFFRDENGRPAVFVESILVLLFDVIFGILGSIVVCYVSRQREFRADTGGAMLAGRDRMIHALQCLAGTRQLVNYDHPEMQTMKISSPKGLFALLMTHPPLEERIERLKKHA
jgi:heat shock protein HtpX